MLQINVCDLSKECMRFVVYGSIHIWNTYMQDSIQVNLQYYTEMYPKFVCETANSDSASSTSTISEHDTKHLTTFHSQSTVHSNEPSLLTFQ